MTIEFSTKNRENCPKEAFEHRIKKLGLKFNLELMLIDLQTAPRSTFSESSTPKFEQFLPSWLVERKISLVSITTSIFCKFSEKGTKLEACVQQLIIVQATCTTFLLLYLEVQHH